MWWLAVAVFGCALRMDLATESGGREKIDNLVRVCNEQ